MVRSMLLAAFLVSSPAMAGVHPTEVEARLGMLVGDWTVVGRETTYRDTCDWFGDRSFVICITHNSAKNSLDQTIVGYSREDGHYTYFSFGNSGESNSRMRRGISSRNNLSERIAGHWGLRLLRSCSPSQIA